MSLIIWRPIMDELDKAKFPFSAPEGWLPLGAWTGRDIYDQDPLYTLELIAGDEDDRPVRRAILWKFVHVPGTRATLRPDTPSEENVADAAGRIGFEFFRSEPKGAGGLWILEETEDGRPVEYRPPAGFEPYPANGSGPTSSSN